MRENTEMPEVRFHGPYVRMNEAILKEKANRMNDPRHPFYEAMLSSKTYEEYYRRVGGVKVQPQTYRTSPVSAHMEMRYARSQMGWIADRRTGTAQR
jgi:hypothetical protein